MREAGHFTFLGELWEAGERPGSACAIEVERPSPAGAA